MSFKFKLTTTKGTTHIVNGKRWRTRAAADEDASREGVSVVEFYADKEMKKVVGLYPLKNIVAMERQ